MKKALLAFLLAFTAIATNCDAQLIDTIIVSPANPTTNDTITVFATCSFPSGGCDPYLTSVSTNGNDIYASSLHCLGQLSFVCYYTDTFFIAPLAAGNYTFYMQLDAGGAPAPCTPGTVPGPVDSISFAVTGPIAVPSQPDKDSFKVLPDSRTGTVIVQVPLHLTKGKSTLQLFSLTGKIIREIKIYDSATHLAERLSPGVYFASLLVGDIVYGQKKFVVVK